MGHRVTLPLPGSKKCGSEKYKKSFVHVHWRKGLIFSREDWDTKSVCFFCYLKKTLLQNNRGLENKIIFYMQ